MTLTLTATERLARARSDLRMGLPVVLSSGGARAAVAAAETLTPDRLATLRSLGQPGETVLAITGRRAATLRARAYDGDLARVRLPAEADAGWVAAVADPARDLDAPLKGPLMTDRGGETALHRAALRLCKSARLLPAALIAPLPEATADGRDLGALTALTAAEASPEGVTGFTRLASARVPLELAEETRLHVFRPADGSEEHYAIEIGMPDRAHPVLCRLHSACFTGDLLGSLKCDCGPQLHAALAQMAERGAGVLLYLNQEGRGIGLANKMRAYSLQDQGFDTVEANHRLGFEDDERDFRIGAGLLSALGIGAVQLMTNNPAKVERLQDCGIEVTERVPLRVGESRFNHHYLATKARKSGHLL